MTEKFVSVMITYHLWVKLLLKVTCFRLWEISVQQ